jgi:hypothetical protein
MAVVMRIHSIPFENFKQLLCDSGNNFPRYLETKYKAVEIEPDTFDWRQFRFDDLELYTEFMLIYG